MKSFANRISTFLTKKGEPGLEEICTILNFDELPVALVDKSNQSVVFINSHLIKLSTFSSVEIKEKPMQDLFSGVDIFSISTGDMRTFSLNRKGQLALPVKARFDFIDAQGRWLVVRIVDQESSDQTNLVQLDEVYQKLFDLTRLGEISDLQLVLQRSVEIAREILHVESTALYQVDSSSPLLKRVVFTGKAEDFPESLPSSDLIRLEKPVIWSPGMRILTEFHRHARINGINYCASSPLIQQEAAFGLLTATGHTAAPSFLSVELLELLAVQILAFFQQSILTQNLHEKITSFQKAINLRNATYENVNEGVVVLDRDLKITDVNPAAEWMLGYASWEAENQAYENILIGTDRLMPALIEAQNGKLTHNIGKASLNRRNGQAFPVLIKVIPVIVDGQVDAIEVFIADISENEQSKALTQQLEHRAVLGDYTAAFAHDVRNPINNISTGIQLLEASMRPDDPDREVINRMQEDCTRLTHLMESFLAFSRPLELKFETIDVCVFLQRILDRWQPRLARVNVKSVVHFEDGLDRIVGDPRSLENVFTNLISNALEAMTESGDTLAVKAFNNHAIQGHPSVEIIVSDNGPGIPTDIMEHIFEPFTTTRKKGTGLGLAITKQIVTAHKGSISVNSFPGGTAFSVRLPAELEKNE